MEERVMDRILHRQVRIGRMRLQVTDVMFIMCLFVFGFLIRWSLMPIESADYFGFLEGWMEQIRSEGGFPSLRHQISNYTSPYMYLMCLVSYLTDNDLYGLKLVSITFDYLGSIAMFLILWQLTGNVRKSVFGMAALLLSPTVILDSAWWCQCDMIYTTFLLFAFLFFLKDNSSYCMAFVGIAFSFKLQAMFFLPFLIIMWLKRRTIRLVDFFWIPLIYVAGALPAWAAGRDLGEVLSVYFEQTGTYPWGTLEYPNIYALLGEAMPDLRHAGEVSGAGTLMTIMLLGCLAFYLYEKEISMTGDFLVTLALFTVAVTVYFLPHMHDRYGFMIDLLAIPYGLLRIRRLPVTCGFMLVSLLTFMPYLIAVHIVPLQYLALAQVGLIIFVGMDLYGMTQPGKENGRAAG